MIVYSVQRECCVKNGKSTKCKIVHNFFQFSLKFICSKGRVLLGKNCILREISLIWMFEVAAAIVHLGLVSAERVK